ncbi:hypothetical protein [Burkholderia pseudomultivorans]|uniref:hypothetical protein n=1 Tax=Burkholderia pseudomultivorans TaxID=1207504 RepID=UPI0009BF4958|nr:hypothetical protein [Burkholderia pseudomultivorans]
MTKPIPSLAVDMRIRIPRGAGLRFGGRYATILQIKPQGTTVHLGNGKLVTFACDTLQDAIRRIGPE